VSSGLKVQDAILRRVPSPTSTSDVRRYSMKNNACLRITVSLFLLIPSDANTS
jgi:hypothetical protein